MQRTCRMMVSVCQAYSNAGIDDFTYLLLIEKTDLKKTRGILQIHSVWSFVKKNKVLFFKVFFFAKEEHLVACICT